jgi:hypothetical protein
MNSICTFLLNITSKRFGTKYDIQTKHCSTVYLVFEHATFFLFLYQSLNQKLHHVKLYSNFFSVQQKVLDYTEFLLHRKLCISKTPIFEKKNCVTTDSVFLHILRLSVLYYVYWNTPLGNACFKLFFMHI